MRSKNAPNYVIAISVILCSVILLAALTFALRGFGWTSGGRVLQIDFRDSTGIRLHSAVRYAGATAGSVTGIRYLSPEERGASPQPRNAVRVTLSLSKDVPPIPSDVRAMVTAETLLGEKFIALSPGEPGAAALVSGAIIQGSDAADFEALARTAQSAIEQVTELLARLNNDYPTLIPKVADLLSQGNSLLVQGSNFVHNADGALTNASQVVAKFRTDYGELVGKLHTLLSQATNIASGADAAIKQVSAFVNRADTLIKNNQGDFHQILAELRVVSQNLKVVSTYTKTLTSTLAERPSRLIWGFKKARLPSEEDILESLEPLPQPPPKK